MGFKKHIQRLCNWRFYCVPKGLVKVSELPPKWGLIYVDEKGRVRIEYDCRRKKIIQQCENDWQWEEYPSGSYDRIVGAPENRFEANMMEERRIMYSALRRLFIKGHLHSIYDKEYSYSPDINAMLELNDTNIKTP